MVGEYRRFASTFKAYICPGDWDYIFKNCGINFPFKKCLNTYVPLAISWCHQCVRVHLLIQAHELKLQEIVRHNLTQRFELLYIYIYIYIYIHIYIHTHTHKHTHTHTHTHTHGSVHRESTLITVQQDATYSVYYISVGSSTCFKCWHPSSGARTAVITASGID